MKVSHKPEFLIALAEGWLESKKDKKDDCVHKWYLVTPFLTGGNAYYKCMYCRKEKEAR